MFGHVLVALDASPRDQAALGAAGALGAVTGGRVTLLLVRDHPTLRRLRPFADAEELSLPDAAQAYVERATERLPDVAAAAASLPGDDAASVVAAYALAHGATLILLPAGEPRHRRRLAARRLARLTALAAVPVLAVPPGAHGNGVRAAGRTRRSRWAVR